MPAEPRLPLHGTLTPNTVANIDLGRDAAEVAVLHKGNVATPLYFTVGQAPANPTTSPPAGFCVLPGCRRVVRRPLGDTAGTTHVKLRSVGGVDWEVEA